MGGQASNINSTSHAASLRGPQSDGVTRLELQLHRSEAPSHATIAVQHGWLPQAPSPHPKSKGRHDPGSTDHRHPHRLQKADGALQAVAPAPASLSTAAATVANRSAERVRTSKILRIREPGVGHVGLKSHAAIKALARTAAAGDGFVVLTHPVAETEIVHRSLTGGQHAEGRKPQQVAERLRQFDIAGHHSSGRTGFSRQPSGTTSRTGAKQPSLSGMSSLSDNAACKARRAGHGQWGIDIAGMLRGCAAEIQGEALLGAIHSNLELQLGAVIKANLLPATGEAMDQLAHTGGGISCSATICCCTTVGP